MDREVELREFVSARGAALSRAAYLLTDAGGGDEEGSATDRLTLRDALARLTSRQRAVLERRFYEDLTESQTALALGISPNTVKSQARVALQRLRELARMRWPPSKEWSHEQPAQGLRRDRRGRPGVRDLDRAIEQADRERRHRHGVAAVLVAAAAVVAVIVGVLAVTRDGSDSQQPIGPVKTPTPTPTEHTSTAATWEPPEPLRPAASRVVQHDEDAFGNALDRGDLRDVADAEIDIVSVGEAFQMGGGSSWRFPARGEDPTRSGSSRHLLRRRGRRRC